MTIIPLSSADIFNKNVIFYAQYRVLCAIFGTFFVKTFVGMNKNVFLCSRIFDLELFINILKTYNHVRN